MGVRSGGGTLIIAGNKEGLAFMGKIVVGRALRSSLQAKKRNSLKKG